MECDTAADLYQIGRTIHIHIQVHTNWTITKNGTVEHSRVVETGQIFFDEQTSAELMAVEPYSQHVEIDRVQNDVDGIYAEQALGEYIFAPNSIRRRLC